MMRSKDSKEEWRSEEISQSNFEGKGAERMSDKMQEWTS